MANIYVTTTGATTKTGATWATAMDLAALKTHLDGSSSGAGDDIYMMQGTYTAVSDWAYTALDGTSDNPWRFIGVKTGTTAEPPTQSDWSDKSDRPSLVWADYNFSFDDHWQIYNFIGTSSLYGFRFDSNALFYNCKFTSTAASSSLSAISCGAFDGRVIGCETITANGRGVKGNAGVMVFNHYSHDCSIGVYVGGEACNIINSILDTCTNAGIQVSGSRNSISIINNSIYNCTDGIDILAGSNPTILSNSFSSCTNGIIHATSGQTGTFPDWNNYSGNTADVTNVTKGGNATANSPGYTDAANGDFTLGTSSAMREAGRPLDVGVG